MVVRMSLDDRSDRIKKLSSVSIKEQVANDLEKDIRSGVIAPDSRLPSELELAEQYGVARGTARDAVGLLRDRGLVVTRWGRGTFSSPDNAPDASDD